MRNLRKESRCGNDTTTLSQPFLQSRKSRSVSTNSNLDEEKSYGESVSNYGKKIDERQSSVACEQQDSATMGAESAMEEGVGGFGEQICEDAHQCTRAPHDREDRL